MKKEFLISLILLFLLISLPINAVLHKVSINSVNPTFLETISILVEGEENYGVV